MPIRTSEHTIIRTRRVVRGLGLRNQNPGLGFCGLRYARASLGPTLLSVYPLLYPRQITIRIKSSLKRRLDWYARPFGYKALVLRLETR